MIVATSEVNLTEGPFTGLRMRADEFLQIPDESRNYELIDGVVIVTPSPTPRHQHVAGAVFRQLAAYLDRHPVGLALMETDVQLGEGQAGGDLVYRPDLVFIPADKVSSIGDKLVGAPALVVEVISRGSRRIDTETKMHDYERLGVREYWLIDPEREAITFLRLKDNRYIEVSPGGDRFRSTAVPGFSLDLPAVRKSFQAW